MNNYYYKLGLKNSASLQEIKTSYRKLSKALHPDKNNSEKFYEEILKEINEAYEILSNIDRKKKYDYEYTNLNNSSNNDISKIQNQLNIVIKEKNTLFNENNILKNKILELKNRRSNDNESYYLKNELNNYIREKKELEDKITKLKEIKDKPDRDGLYGMILIIILAFGYFYFSNNSKSENLSISEVTNLEKKNKSFLNQINELNSKYNEIKSENNILKTANESYLSEVIELKSIKENEPLNSTQLSLEETKTLTDSILILNNALAELVSNSAVLATVSLKGFGVVEKSSGKIIPTERASRTDKINICFTVTKNKLLQSGYKKLYIQVIDPKKNTLGLDKQIEIGSKRLNYSMVSIFNYLNSNLNICEFVHKKNNTAFDKGLYIVNVFNEKDLVATSEFMLK